MVKVFVPTRLNSSRLPGKPLVQIAGKTLLARCCQSISANGYTPIVLAPDMEIINFCKGQNIDVVQTGIDCLNGTERVAEACDILKIPDDEIVVNCQGDMFGWKDPSFLSTPIEAVKADPQIMATVYSTEFSLLDIASEDTVKVLSVKNKISKGPRFRFTRTTTRHILPSLLGVHYGVYVATAGMFREYASRPQTYLEMEEKLEQLRWNQREILAIRTEERPIKIDTPEDLSKAESLFMGGKYANFDDPL